MLVTNHQSGNKKYHSTETLSLLVTNHLYNATDEGKVTAMVFIDLRKAFDSICHETLLSKLKSLGCSSRALAWFRSYLTDRQQTTRIGTSVSSPLTVTHGVPQGSILGPILFSLYMNDLPKAISNCKIESYVDDTKLYISFTLKDQDSAIIHLQQDLSRFAEWCCANHLLINPTKTKIMLFGTRQNLSRFNDFRVTFLEQVLTPVKCCKDLGITLDGYLSFDDHITSLSSSLLGKLCQINRVRHLFSKRVLNVIINSLVFSQLFYCSTVWSGTTIQNIQKLQLVQNFAARILTETRKYDHISPVLENLGWLPIKDLLKLRDVTMVFKCLNGLAPTYLSSKLAKRSSVHKYSTRRASDIHLPRYKTTTAQRSFFYRAAKEWNSLTDNAKSCTSVAAFKKEVRKDHKN